MKSRKIGLLAGLAFVVSGLALLRRHRRMQAEGLAWQKRRRLASRSLRQPFRFVA